MSRRARAIHFPGGAGVFSRMFTRLGCTGRPPRFQVEFYPYANLTHTIRIREDVAHVRLSDLLRRARLADVEATAAVLLARLYRVPLPPRYAGAYRQHALNPSTRRRLLSLRRRRAPRAQEGPRGAVYDLAALFRTLNREYFGGRLRRPRLAWSARPWRMQLGCYDPALRQILINVRLDRPGVPRHAVEYVLYHEMLHARHPAQRARCGLSFHSPEFRREEKRFRQYAAARRYLARLR
jgi:hypothetical protein